MMFTYRKCIHVIKNIHCISFFGKKIFLVYQEKIYHRYFSKGIPLVERLNSLPDEKNYELDLIQSICLENKCCQKQY